VPERLQKNYSDPATRADFCALAVCLYERLFGEIMGRKTFESLDFAGVTEG
jgi:dihydrofolate reductase